MNGKGGSPLVVALDVVVGDAVVEVVVGVVDVVAVVVGVDVVVVGVVDVLAAFVVVRRVGLVDSTKSCSVSKISKVWTTSVLILADRVVMIPLAELEYHPVRSNTARRATNKT